MSWWWEFFDEQNMTPYLRSAREISDRMIKAGNGEYKQFKVDAGLLEAYGVKCGKTSFVYLLNNTDKKISTAVKLPPQAKITEANAFSPGNRSYKKVKTISTTLLSCAVRDIQLNPREELVLILK